MGCDLAKKGCSAGVTSKMSSKAIRVAAGIGCLKGGSEYRMTDDCLEQTVAFVAMPTCDKFSAAFFCGFGVAAERTSAALRGDGVAEFIRIEA